VLSLPLPSGHCWCLLGGLGPTVVLMRVSHLSRLWSAWRGHDLGLRFVTLTFNSVGRESGFLASRKADVVSQASLLSCLALLLALTVVLLEAVTGHGRKSSEHLLTYRIQLVGIGVIASMSLATFLPLQFESLRTRASTSLLEVYLTLLCCTGLCVAVLSHPAYLSKMLNHDLVQAYGEDVYYTDSMILLTIDGVVTATHLGLAIRWKLLFFVEVVSIFLYAFIVFAVGSVEHGGAHYNLAFLLGLVIASSLAKRSAEVTERKAFVDVLDERTLRYTAEFRLSSSSRDVRSEAGPESVTDSLPATTATGRIFESACTEGDDTKELLEQVKSMGIREHWYIDSREVKLLPDRVLGTGGFGVVMKGFLCGMQVAVKMSRSAIQSADAGSLSELCNELRVFRRLRHQNIVAMHGAIIDVRCLQMALVLELVQGMQLDRFIGMPPQRSSETPGLMARYQLILGISSALIYLHTRDPQIVHGDLKPSNIMVESSGDAVCPRLLDFGLSCVLTRGSKPLGGTPQWMPPEVLINSSSKQCSTDIYSFGHLVAFMATGTMPMSGLSYPQMIKRLRRRKPPMPVWPAACPFEHTFKPLVTRCLDMNAASRPSAQEAHLEILQQLDSLHLEGDSALFLQEHLIAEAWDQGIADRILAPAPDTSGNRRTPIHAEAHPADASNVVVPLATESPEAAPAASAAQTSAALLPTSRLAL